MTTDDSEEPEWVTALDREDEPEGEPPPARTALPPKVEAWRRRSATGAILTGFALGLREVLEPEARQPAVIMQTSGDPPMELPVEAEVEQARPRHSVVTIRPWLLGKAGTKDDPAGSGEPEPERPAG